MGKVKVKFYYPEFSNILLSLYALSEIDTNFGRNYRALLRHRNRVFSAEDKQYLQIFRTEIAVLTKNLTQLPKFLNIILDHRVENLIMLKRRIDKEFGSFDCSKIDRVYLYFYKKLSEDYQLFQPPIISALSRLERQIEDQKIAFHLEKFHKFLEKERLMKIDSHFFVSCNYFGEGKRARFERMGNRTILFYLPIMINERGNISLNFDEKAFLEQIFYHCLSYQFEESEDKFSPIFNQHQIDKVHFQGAMIGALHYGLYSFDVHKEILKLTKVTDHLERKLLESQIDRDQVSFAIRLTPILDRFYQDRKGLDEEFLNEAVKIYEQWRGNGVLGQPPVTDVKKIEAEKTKREARKGVIFEAP